MMQFAAIGAFCTLLVMAPPHARGGDISVGDLIIERPWALATTKLDAFAIGFVSLINIGASSDRLKSATTERSERVEIYSVTLTTGRVQRRRLTDGLELGARSVTDLKPGGYHLRFVGLKRPLQKGESFNVRFNFEKAGAVDVLFLTTGLGEKSPYPDAKQDTGGSASGSRSGRSQKN